MKKIQEQYIKYHQQQIINKQKFNASKNISFDYDWENRQNELYVINRFNYLHLEALEHNLIPVFVTLTLPSEYHQFKQTKKGKFVKNPKYLGYTIEQGYKELNSIFRDLYNKFNIYSDGKVLNQKVKYSRVIEPHKDFTPHLHAVLYVEDANLFHNHFNNVVNRYSLEQVDFEVLQTANHSIAYLLKYVQKTVSGSNAIIQGWKSQHKIVQVTTSRMPFSKVQYTAFVRAVKYNPKYKNIYYQMEEEGYFVKHQIFISPTELAQYRYIGLSHLFYEKFEEFSYQESGNFIDPIFTFHEYKIKTNIKKYVEVEYHDEEHEYLFEEVQKYDDMFDLPMSYYDSELDIHIPISNHFHNEDIIDIGVEYYAYDESVHYYKIHSDSALIK